MLYSNSDLNINVGYIYNLNLLRMIYFYYWTIYFTENSSFIYFDCGYLLLSKESYSLLISKNNINSSL